MRILLFNIAFRESKNILSGKSFHVNRELLVRMSKAAASVPCVPGYHGENQDPTFLYEEAKKIGRISGVSLPSFVSERSCV